MSADRDEIEFGSDADEVARRLLMDLHALPEGRDPTDIALAQIWATLAVATEVAKLREVIPARYNQSPTATPKVT
jgi:hypothetical protein